MIAVGVVSVMGLFPAGLKANQQSVNETRIAMFAEDVMNGVKAVIDETPWKSVVDVLQDDGIPLVGSGMFDRGILGNEIKMLKGDPADPDPVRFKYALPGSDREEFAMRYHLVVFPDLSRYPPYGIRFRITLQVWPNEYGPLDEGFVFYSEVYHNHRF